VTVAQPQEGDPFRTPERRTTPRNYSPGRKRCSRRAFEMMEEVKVSPFYLGFSPSD
jgi:hypothetical protein